MSRRFPIALAGVLLITAGCGEYDNLTPAQALVLMDDPASADARRAGMAYLVTHVDACRVPPYSTHYQHLAKTDPDYIVRAMAIRALNICRDPSATPIFIAGLGDDNEPVRLESAKALANVPDPAAAEPLIRVAQGQRRAVVNGNPMVVAEDRDVRIAAADALRRCPTLDVERTLVGFLDDPEFAVAWQSRQSLIALTGQDLGYDEVAWLRLLVKSGGPG
jgi:HEAT repeat protein